MIQRTQALLTVAVLVLAGCATQPVTITDARPLTESRLLPGFEAYRAPFPGGAKVVVVRDKGLYGSALTMKLFVDGQPVGLLRPSDRLELYVPLGSHVLGVEPQPLLEKSIREQAFVFDQAKSYFFRISIPSVGEPEISPTTRVQ